MIPSGHRLQLKDVSWPMFENILEELGETRAARLAYSNGILEIMAPLAVHEDDKEIIGDLVKIILEELDIEFRALGSTTFKNEQMAQAVEPDECFYIQHEAVIRGKKRIDLTIDPPPDLAIEIDITARTQFHHYQLLGVPELWRYDGQKLQINVLQNGQYIISEISYHFPNLPLFDNIPDYVSQSQVDGRNATMRRFRRWVREMINKTEGD
ncbi:MAG TPA: hypothetical protein DCM38_10625 [Gammaproteobacteria bacterium]|nr:hypothetical protein [Gammaproteobacteria bacterium]